MRHLRTAAIVGGAIGGALLMAGTSVAAPVAVDGINVSGTGSDVEVASLFETFAKSKGDTLSGFGQVTTVNGDTNFCAGSSCELTFTFNGYSVDTVTNSHEAFTGGTVKFYADSSPDFSASDMSSAEDGQLFLSTIGHSYTDSTSGLTGTLIATGTNLNGNSPSGFGTGYLDVTGGDAAQYFDTNSFDLGGATAADLQFNSSFSQEFCGGTGTNMPVCGSADIHSCGGNAGPGQPPVSVPEPSALGLMGLGLIGLGFAFRRRRQG